MTKLGVVVVVAEHGEAWACVTRQREERLSLIMIFNTDHGHGHGHDIQH